GKVVEFVQDGDLRDAENISLNPDVDTTDLIESYFKREVQPHVPDAWINAERAYGYAQGDQYRVKNYEQPEQSGEYVVVDPPLLGSQPRQTDEGNTVHVPMVTVYFAPIAMWIFMDKLPDKGEIK
ncbi:MAG: hypothetical protein EOP54_22065, partial [Sphingobacteriales bacterium]